MSSTINKFLGAASLACAALLMPLSAAAEEEATKAMFALWPCPWKPLSPTSTSKPAR